MVSGTAVATLGRPSSVQPTPEKTGTCHPEVRGTTDATLTAPQAHTTPTPAPNHTCAHAYTRVCTQQLLKSTKWALGFDLLPSAARALCRSPRLAGVQPRKFSVYELLLFGRIPAVEVPAHFVSGG